MPSVIGTALLLDQKTGTPLNVKGKMSVGSGWLFANPTNSPPSPELSPATATLTLVSSEIRMDGNSRRRYAKDEDSEDSRFVRNFAALQSVAVSHAQNDSGLFELNFRDERYLPFEFCGAISTWKIELPPDNNAFDFDSLTDFVIKLNYTAREGGPALEKRGAVAPS